MVSGNSEKYHTGPYAKEYARNMRIICITITVVEVLEDQLEESIHLIDDMEAERTERLRRSLPPLGVARVLASGSWGQGSAASSARFQGLWDRSL